MSLINHDGDSLDCGHYVSDVFDGSTGIWWHCDDGNITQITDRPKVVYYRESHKNKNKMSGSTSNMKKHSSNLFNNSQPFPKSLI